MKISRELKTGVTAVLIIALFIWGYNFLKGLNLFNPPARTFYTEYKNVQGLNTASVVTINGVNVGKVLNIIFNEEPDKRGNLIVEFSIENNFSFAKTSVAKIYSASLMGGKSLAVIPSYDGETAVSGDFLNGEIESDIFSSVTEKLNPLQAKVENVIVSADSLMVGLNSILDQRTRANIRSSIEQLNHTVINFKKASINLDQILESNKSKLNKTLTNIESASTNLDKLSDSLVNSNISQTIKKLQSTLDKFDGILSGLESGEGTAGKLLKDDEMYSNLSNASKELEELLREMKLHPKRFVHFSLFGKKDKGYQLEKDSIN